MLTVHHLIRSRRRTLGLEISEEAKIVVRAPLRASVHSIETFLASHQKWIEQKQQIALKRLAETPRRNYIAGSSLKILGRLRILTVSRAVKKACLNDELLILPAIHKKEPIVQIEKLLRQEALNWITPRAHTQAARLGYTPKKIRITGATTRWGSCGPDGSLHFSWRLFLAPPAVVDYVIVHEVAHLKHKNHSQRFWDLVAKLDPSFKTHRTWLRGHGHQLTL